MFVMTGFALFLKIVGILDEREVSGAIALTGVWSTASSPARQRCCLTSRAR